MTDASSLKGKTGLHRLINATRYSWQGLCAAWTHEDAFRTELVLAVVLIPIAVLLPVPLAEKLLCILATMLVLIVEILNSAIEATVDRCGMEIHPLAGRAKDMASAAVTLSLVAAGSVWVAVLAELCLA